MRDYRIIIGNNSFPLTPGNDLRGCHRDAELVGQTLFDCFGKAQFEAMVFDCVKDNFVSRLQHATIHARRGNIDRLTIWLSTHGTVISDSNESNFVTGIVFSDATYDGSQGILKDREFKVLLDEVPDSCLVEVFCDFCHSGTGTRAVPEGVLVNSRPRFFDIGYHGMDTVRTKHTALTRSSGVQNVVAWGGCQDRKTAADASFADGYNGAFTRAWCEVMAENEQMTRSDVLKAVTERLRPYKQTPTLNAQ